MATSVAIQQPSLTAAAPTALAADATGNYFVPDQGNPLFIRVINASGASVTCTIDDPTSVSPTGATTFNPDVPVVVPANSTRLVKVASPSRFVDPNTGRITLAWSAATSITFELIQ